jgi:hypothetical protein
MILHCSYPRNGRLEKEGLRQVVRSTLIDKLLTELLISLHGMDNQALQRVRQAGYYSMAGWSSR